MLLLSQKYFKYVRNKNFKNDNGIFFLLPFDNNYYFVQPRLEKNFFGKFKNFILRL